MSAPNEKAILADMIAASADVRLKRRTFWQTLGRRLDWLYERLAGPRSFRKAAERFGQSVQRIDGEVLAALSDSERRVVVDEIEATIAEVERYVSGLGRGRSSPEARQFVTLIYELRAVIERVHGGGRLRV